MQAKMHYRYIRKTGLTVSAIGFGNSFNSLASNDEQAQKNLNQVVKKCFELGINFYDTAEVYGFGKGEEMMGKALLESGQCRSNYILTTKLLGPNFLYRTLSRKHILEGINLSLSRLNHDYVDIIYAHRYDPNTPIEEMCRSFNKIIEEGKAFYWGTSMWTVEEILKAHQICDKLDLIKPVVEQPDYNMLQRGTVEGDYSELFEEYEIGVTTFSPLAGGLLSGKYNKGKNDKGSRFSGKGNQKVANLIKGLYIKDENIFYEVTDQLEVLSNQLKCTMPQLALAWVLMNKNVNVAITCGSNIEQLEDTCKAIDLCKIWTVDIESKIENILKNAPTQRINWDTWKPYPGVRISNLNYDLLK